MGAYGYILIMEFVEILLDDTEDMTPYPLFSLPPDAADFNMQETEEGIVISFLRCNNVEMHLGVGHC